MPSSHLCESGSSLCKDLASYGLPHGACISGLSGYLDLHVNTPCPFPTHTHVRYNYSGDV